MHSKMFPQTQTQTQIHFITAISTDKWMGLPSRNRLFVLRKSTPQIGNSDGKLFLNT
jgi:hypothetical protein